MSYDKIGDGINTLVFLGIAAMGFSAITLVYIAFQLIKKFIL